jgi:hypothetical protein
MAHGTLSFLAEPKQPKLTLKLKAEAANANAAKTRQAQAPFVPCGLFGCCLLFAFYFFFIFFLTGMGIGIMRVEANRKRCARTRQPPAGSLFATNNHGAFFVFFFLVFVFLCVCLFFYFEFA